MNNFLRCFFFFVFSVYFRNLLVPDQILRMSPVNYTIGILPVKLKTHQLVWLTEMFFTGVSKHSENGSCLTGNKLLKNQFWRSIFKMNTCVKLRVFLCQYSQQFTLIIKDIFAIVLTNCQMYQLLLDFFFFIKA